MSFHRPLPAFLRAMPAAEHNIYSVGLKIKRLSGEDASWRRVNQRFMNVIRKQFLIWRTVDTEAKDGYREQGAEILQGLRSEVTACGTMSSLPVFLFCLSVLFPIP